MSETVSINADVFSKRLKQLYSHWKDHSTFWAGSHAIAVPFGGTSDDLRYLKSLALHLWLFGYELPDTVLVFLPSELHILSSQKKIQILQPLSAASEKLGVKLVMHVRPKGEEGSEQTKAMFAAVRAAQDVKEIVVGTLKEKHTGKLVESFNNELTASGFRLVDVALGFADIFAVKDPSEILNHKKAAMLACRVMSDFIIAQIEGVLDDGKSMKHSKLAESTEGIVSEPTKIGVKLLKEKCDVAYPPIIQSGGNYDLRVKAGSDDLPLHHGVIVLALGTRYSFYCANLSRTIVINPTPTQTAEYQILLAAQEAVIASLVEGGTTAQATDAAIKAVKDSPMPYLVEHLSRSLGYGMGLELRESSAALSIKQDSSKMEHSSRPFHAGQVFNVCLSFTNLQNPNAKEEKGKTYALQVADTVVVSPSGKAPETVTSSCAKGWDKVSYTLQDNDDDDEEDVKDQKLGDLTNAPLLARKSLRSDNPNHKSVESIRKEKQEELVKQKNEETLRRLTAQKDGDQGSTAVAGRKISDVVSYKSILDMVAVVRDLVITVDGKAEAVLLPIYGVLVPFHITTIKNVSHSQDNDHAHIRVTFNFGGNYEPYQRFSPNAVFLKELSFRSSDVKHANKVVQDIKLLRSTVTLRDKERAERATLVAQEKLIQGKRVYKLPDLWMRPAMGGKGRKVPGTLEAHVNGFRYVNPRHISEPVHVMYRNIKHAFFQPADGSAMITVLHFHLINPIMLGNKKTKDVQFYSEVMDVVQTLDGGRRNMYDPDEIEEEQRERERRNKINQEFQSFVKRVQELWEKDFADLSLEFDVPFRELAFNGVPHRQTVSMLPTVNCLIEVTEMPFTVISLADIEVINLERVGFRLKNFDMAIVLKDFTRDVIRIDAIESKSLDTIKDWLTSMHIKYYESKLNMAWKPILKSIADDPDGFIENGGWEFLNMEKSDEEGEDGSEVSEDYAPDDSEEDDDDDDDSDDSGGGSVVDSDDEDEEDDDEEEDEDEEEGKSWDELEEEAKRADKSKQYDDDDADDRVRGGKRKGGGTAPSGGAVKKRR